MKFDAYREGKRKSESTAGDEEIHAFVKCKNGDYYLDTSYHQVYFDEEFLQAFIKAMRKYIPEGSQEFIDYYGVPSFED